MFHTPLLRSTNLDFNCKKRKKVDRFFCTPLVMKFDEKAGYAGNSQRVNQDCLHAHIPEYSCDGDSTDAPLSNWPSQAASTRCMASDYQNDRTCHSNIVSSCWLLQTVWPVEQSASLSSEGCLLFQSKIHEPSKGYAGRAVSES